MERTDRWDYASPSNDLLQMWVDFMNLNNLFLLKIMILRRCFICSTQRLSQRNLQTLRQHALRLLFMPPAPTPSSSEAQAPVRDLFPFVYKPNSGSGPDRDNWGKISVMRDWERDLESGEQKTSEAGEKEAYATLVNLNDQGSRVNCFNLTFLQSSLHLRSLRHWPIASIQ